MPGNNIENLDQAAIIDRLANDDMPTINTYNFFNRISNLIQYLPSLSIASSLDMQTAHQSQYIDHIDSCPLNTVDVEKIEEN